MPYAVLGAMTFPYIFYSTGSLGTGVAGALVAFVLAFMRKSLLTVAACSALVAFVTGMLLV